MEAEGVDMKGIVFTEFVEMVEKKFGLAVADRMIGNSISLRLLYCLLSVCCSKPKKAEVGFNRRDNGFAIRPLSPLGTRPHTHTRNTLI